MKKLLAGAILGLSFVANAALALYVYCPHRSLVQVTHGLNPAKELEKHLGERIKIMQFQVQMIFLVLTSSTTNYKKMTKL